MTTLDEKRVLALSARRLRLGSIGASDRTKAAARAARIVRPTWHGDTALCRWSVCVCLRQPPASREMDGPWANGGKHVCR